MKTVNPRVRGRTEHQVKTRALVGGEPARARKNLFKEAIDNFVQASCPLANHVK